MSDKVNKKDIEDIVGKSTGEILEVFQAFVYSVDERFSKIEERLDDVATKKSIDRLTDTLDAFLKRLDDNETEQAARDIQFNRLVEWARVVSEKTGVPMPDL